EGIPLVLVIDKKYKAIEQKIQHDRDRNAFGEPLLKTFFNLFARHGLDGNDSGQRVVVEAARSFWKVGHAFLVEIAAPQRWSKPWPRQVVKEVFGDGYFARSTSANAAEQFQFETLERSWRAQGKVGLPQYFAQFGLLNAEDNLQKLRAKTESAARRNSQ